MREEFKDIIWTYGSHEPMSMYLRGRRRSTAGLCGGAHWVPEWHRYFDSEDNVSKMAELGLNYLHCRFYKGMGWEFEKEDFPNVVEFVKRCHAHGISVLGYVQFGTLYFESMRYEIPDLEDWSAFDEDGHHVYYSSGRGEYYRWMPCLTQKKFWEYLKSVITIGIRAAHFDGIMLDNCFTRGCWCPRCKARFREYLQAHYRPSDFGVRGFDFVEPPSVQACRHSELEDPVVIAWRDFQAELLRRGYQELHEHIKSLGRELVVCGNVAAIARKNVYTQMGVDYFRFAPYFDLLMDQNANEPMVLSSGAIVHRVRDCMLGEAAGRDLFVLTDGAGDVTETDPRIYATTMMEAKVFQTIPTDRVMMIPGTDGVVTWRNHPERVAALEAFRRVSARYKESFYAENYAPVGVVYSVNSQHLSESSYDALVSAEEVLLRRHVPFRLAVGDGHGVAIPDHCDCLLLFGARCLSDGEVQSVVSFAKNGGRVVMDGMAGVCDEENREIGCDRFAGVPNIRRVPSLKPVVPNGGWRMEILMPENPDVLENALPQLPFKVDAPETVFIRVNRLNGKWLFHFINYSHEPCKSATIVFSETIATARTVTFESPDEMRPSEVAGGHRISVPEFVSWAMVEV